METGNEGIGKIVNRSRHDLV